MDFLFKLSIIPSSILGTFLIYKTFFGVPKYTGDEDLSGKIALVTGSSSGIGLEIAYRLAKRNATLILGCRDLDTCKKKRLLIFDKTKNKNIYCSKLDLESIDSVRDFIIRLKNKKYDHIDILVNSAGFKGGDDREITKNFIEKHLGVNVIGSYLLTKLLIPFLTAAEGARVLYLICPQYAKGNINVNDINNEKDYNKDKAFSQSQLMRMLIMKYFSDEIDPSKVTFNACDPGPTYSNFHDKSNYNNYFLSRWIFRYINTMILRNTWQAAETPVMCCVSKDLIGTSGELYRDLQVLDIDAKATDKKMMNYVNLLCDKWSKTTNISLTNKLIS